ncbi:MAG: hypothetical protein AB7H77_03345 [Bdellovibrionales bacterium]
MPNIACLHAAESNIGLFDSTRRDLNRKNVFLTRYACADLPAAAERAGELTPEILKEAGDGAAAPKYKRSN